MNAPAFPLRYTMNSTHGLGYGSGPSPASLTIPTVFVVDDDDTVREALELLIRRERWQPETFPSPQEFLARPRALVPNCLVLDVSLPEFNGLDLQGRVAIERPDMSIIFIAAEMRAVRNCYASLSPRERQVMRLLVSGLLNKQVGGELGITEHMVKLHRGRVMQKMQAKSFAHLVRIAAKLGVALRPECNEPSCTTFV